MIKNSVVVSKLAICSLALALAARVSHAATISMNANDASTTPFTSSLNTGAHWIGGAAPTAGNDYNTSAFLLRTPQDTASYTFAGDSLTLSNSASAGAGN